MNHNETSDWKAIAHEEFENRKRMEAQLGKNSDALDTLRQTLTTSSSYNVLLEKQMSQLEAQCKDTETKFARSIELLKNAKILVNKRRAEIEKLNIEKMQLQRAKQEEINTLQNAFATLKIENAKLKEDLNAKSVMLVSEMNQHEKTHHQLAQALNRLANVNVDFVHNAPALPPPARYRISSPDVIYAEGPVGPLPKGGFFSRMFASYDEFEPSDGSKFLDQVLYFDRHYNK